MVFFITDIQAPDVVLTMFSVKFINLDHAFLPEDINFATYCMFSILFIQLQL